MRLNLSLILLAAATLAACQPKAAAPAEAPAAAAELAPQPFDVAINYSEAAKAELARTGERVIVDAMYYAWPTPTEAETLEAGDSGIDLGDEQIETGPEAARVTAAGALVTGAAETLGGRAPRVLVNVYSARLKGPDNILSCGIFEDELSKAAAGVTIDCALITEPS